MLALAAARAQAGTTVKHGISVQECQNILHCNVKKKNVFYMGIYQNFIFLEKLWLLKLFIFDESKRAMTVVSQGQKV